MTTKQQSSRAIVCVFGDLQGGHKQGLLHPETLIQEWDDTGNPYDVPVKLNPAQEYLWDLLEEGLTKTADLAGKDPIYIITMGDLTEGNKYPKAMVSSSKANQVTIAYDILAHAFAKLKARAMRLVISTDSHAFDENAADVLIEKQLKAEFPKANIKLVGHGLATINKAKIDYAHHGVGGGIRVWLDGDEARRYMKDIAMSERMAGNRPPDVILRADRHVRVCEHLVYFVDDVMCDMWGIQVPSFQFLTNYARQATRSARTITNGMLAIEIHDMKGFTAGNLSGSKITPHWYTRTREMPLKETII